MVHIAKDHKRVRRHDEEHMIRTACAMLVAALVFSAAHAENCTPPADDYIGTRSSDRSCQPLEKSAAKYFDRNDDCTPNLEGRGTMMIGQKGEKCELAFRRVPHCTPPADEYMGVWWGSDGGCHPIRRNKLMNFNDCEPELKGRGTLVLGFPKIVDGQTPLECVIEVSPLPRSPVQDLQQQIDELRDEIGRLKSGH
jgi:hypothetical protein